MKWLPLDARTTGIGDLFFDREIRVQVDLAQLRVLDPRLAVRVATAGDLARWTYPPWFWLGKELARFDSPGARPHSFRWVSRNATRVDFTPVRDAGALLMPCYRLTGSRTVLALDGNHRMLHFLLHRPEATVVQLAILAPVSRHIIPDLVHWERVSTDSN